METDEEGFSATVMKFYLQRSYKLEWIFRGSGRDKGMQNMAWRTEASLRIVKSMPGLLCGIW